MGNKVKKIYVSTHSILLPDCEIYYFGVLFLRAVFSIETRPLRHEEMSLVTEISAIIVIQFRCW